MVSGKMTNSTAKENYNVLMVKSTQGTGLKVLSLQDVSTIVVIVTSSTMVSLTLSAINTVMVELHLVMVLHL